MFLLIIFDNILIRYNSFVIVYNLFNETLCNNIFYVVPPTFNWKDENIFLTVMKGDTFELDCSLTGIPFPEIAWIKVVLNI